MTWKFCVVATCLLIVLAFAMIFQPNITTPAVFGVPYILWTSVLLTIILVILTWLGGKSFPHKEN